MCLGALKQGFLARCRPFLGVDGCHLTGPFKGILLQAVGVDGNNCTYPVAYAVVEGETKETWKWLFELLSEDLNIYSQPHFTFMSDQQKVIFMIVLFQLNI